MRPTQQPIETAERVKRQYKKYSYLKHLYDNLHRAGIPWYKVHHYKTPTESSGYLGGETIRVYFKGELIDNYDNVVKDGNAHGELVYEFDTIKSLRDYIDLCEKKNNPNNNFNVRMLAMRQKMEMERSLINQEKSKMHKFYDIYD